MVIRCKAASGPVLEESLRCRHCNRFAERHGPSVGPRFLAEEYGQLEETSAAFSSGARPISMAISYPASRRPPGLRSPVEADGFARTTLRELHRACGRQEGEFLHATGEARFSDHW